MSLVVSELSRHGFVMVGDSSLVSDEGILRKRFATKVHYSTHSRVGITCWGIGGIEGSYIDEYLASVIKELGDDQVGFEVLANKIAESVNQWFDEYAIPQEKRVGGVHIGGYTKDGPKLWHIHRSDKGTTPYSFEVAKDWPESKGIPQKEFNEQIRHRPVYVFNGQHVLCNIVLQHMWSCAGILKIIEQTDFPEASISGRINYVKLLVRIVAGICFSTTHPRLVTEDIVYLAFDSKGIQTRGFSKIRETEDLESEVFLLSNL